MENRGINWDPQWFIGSSPTSGWLQAIFQVLKLAVHDSDFWGSSKGVNRFGSSLEFVGSPAPVFGPKWIVVLCGVNSTWGHSRGCKSGWNHGCQPQ